MTLPTPQAVEEAKHELVCSRLLAHWKLSAASQETILGVLQSLPELRQKAEILDLINQLREPEGSMVMLICPNPDFNGLPNENIEVSNDWTGYEPKKFSGNTLLEALRAAAAHKLTPPTK